MVSVSDWMMSPAKDVPQTAVASVTEPKAAETNASDTVASAPENTGENLASAPAINNNIERTYIDTMPWLPAEQPTEVVNVPAPAPESAPIAVAEPTPLMPQAVPPAMMPDMMMKALDKYEALVKTREAAPPAVDATH
jgi:hypothetical protein